MKKKRLTLGHGTKRGEREKCAAKARCKICVGSGKLGFTGEEPWKGARQLTKKKKKGAFCLLFRVE